MKRLLIGIFTFLMGLGCMAQSDYFGSMVPARQTKSILPDTPNVTDAQGRKQGLWSKKYDNGNCRYRATFKDDQVVDSLVRYHENGKKSALIVYRADGVGNALLYDESERPIAQGLYRGNLRDSLWRLFDAEHHVTAIEPYDKGVLNGVVTVYYPNGDVAEETSYVNGIKQGPWRQYFRGMAKKVTASYRNGQLHGEFKGYNQEAICDVDGQYDNGREQGIWKLYDNDTHERYELNYNNGVLINAAELDERMQKKAAEYEKQRKFIKDPDNFRADPEGYLR